MQHDLSERITTVAHIHYPKVSKRTKRDLKKVRNYGPVIITTTNTEIAAQLESEGFLAIRVENKGRNFGALLNSEVLNRIVTGHILHLHIKQSKHAPIFGALWNFVLWRHLVSASSIKKYLQKASGAPIFLGFPNMSKVFANQSRLWGQSEKFINELPLPERNYCRQSNFLIFPMGGMFLCSKELLLELKRIQTDSKLEFVNEPIAKDGELPHFLERLVGVVAFRKGGVIFL